MHQTPRWNWLLHTALLLISLASNARVSSAQGWLVRPVRDVSPQIDSLAVWLDEVTPCDPNEALRLRPLLRMEDPRALELLKRVFRGERRCRQTTLARLLTAEVDSIQPVVMDWIVRAVMPDLLPEVPEIADLRRTMVCWYRLPSPDRLRGADPAVIRHLDSLGTALLDSVLASGDCPGAWPYGGLPMGSNWVRHPYLQIDSFSTGDTRVFLGLCRRYGKRRHLPAIEACLGEAEEWLSDSRTRREWDADRLNRKWSSVERYDVLRQSYLREREDLLAELRSR